MKRLPGLVSLALIPFTGMLGCLPASSNRVLQQISSSDFTATLSQLNSGAMSRGATLVSLRANATPDSDTHGQVVFSATWDKPIAMNWIDPKHLELTCSSCTTKDVTFEVVKTGEVLISYDSNLRAVNGVVREKTALWETSSRAVPYSPPTYDKGRYHSSNTSY